MTYHRIKDRLKKSDFFKNLAVLSSGTAFAQAVSLVTAPALTRIYHPADYGLLGVYMTFCTLLGTLSTLQYNHAIVIAKEDKDAEQVLKLCWIINLLVSLLVALAMVFLKTPISRIYNNPALQSWLFLAPVSIFFVGLNTIFSSWAIRKGNFKLLSRNRIYTALLAPAFSIGVGLVLNTAWGLFVGLLISQVVPTFRMSYFFISREQFNFSFNRAVLRRTMQEYRNFPRFSLPSDFINNFSNQIPIVMLSQLGGPKVVGWYNLSVRMLGLPSSLISTAVGDIFRQRASQDYHAKGSCRPVFLNILKFLSFIAVFPLIILTLWGPDIFAFFFGEKWREAGQIARILSLLYAFRFVVSPLSYTTYIANKQWVSLVMDIVLLFSLLTILYVARFNGLPYQSSLLMLSFTYSALYVLTFYLSYKYAINDKFRSKD